MINQQKIKQIFIIGDSFCDMGTLTTVSEDIFRKIKHEYFHKYSLPKIKKIIIKKPYMPTCLSNGELFPSIVARKFNFKIESAWDYDYDEIKSSKIGNNYALIGSRIEMANFQNGLGALIFDRFTIENQINALVKQHEINAGDCILITIGANDLIFNHQKQNTVDKIIFNLKINLEKLIDANAQKIILFEMIDLGKIPRFKYENQKSLLLTSLSNQFNEKVKQLANFFAHKHKNLQIHVYPLFNIIKNLSQKFMTNYNHESFDGVLKMDLITMIQQGVIKSKLKSDLIYKKKINYFYLDDVHLSKWVHIEIAEDLYIFLNQIF